MAVAEAVVENGFIERENSAKVVWALAWPVVALNSLQVVNTLLDRFFVGHLSASALTGYGGTTVITFLMFSLAVSLAMGATAIVSRAFGADNPVEYRRAAQESLSLSMFGGVLIGLLTAWVAGYSADLLLPANDPEARREMTRFLIAYSFGLPATFVIQAVAGSLRGVGDTKSPMYISGVQILCHMTLNTLLIFPTRHVGPIVMPGAGLGLQGGAIALATSGWIAAIVYLFFLYRTRLGHLSPFRPPNLHWTYRILRIAVPAGVMSTLRVFSLLTFTIVLKQVTHASDAIAAMSIGFAIESMMFMPPFGLAAAAAALVGQSLGMKRPDRAERLAWTAGHHGSLVMLCLSIPIFITAPQLVGFLVEGKEGIAYQSVYLLRSLCVTEFTFAYSMVLMGAMQGAGDTVRPLWITVVALWGLRVPAAAILALPAGFKLAGYLPMPLALGYGPAGAWAAMSLSQAVMGLISIFVFKMGHWKTEMV